MATDSLGFKNSGPIDVPLSTAKHRILFIGDSFTEGVGLTYRDTFVGHIADRLSQDNIGVLNAVAVSYLTDHLLAKGKIPARGRDLTFDEIVVFLDVSNIDDEANRYTLADGDRVVWPEFDQPLRGRRSIQHPVTCFIRSRTILLYWVLNAVRDIVEPRPMSAVESVGAPFESRFGVDKTDRSLWTVDPQRCNGVGKRSSEIGSLHGLIARVAREPKNQNDGGGLPIARSDSP